MKVMERMSRLGQVNRVLNFGWLNNPLTFTVSSPILTILGAVSTIVAPILLDPASFAEFALMISIFQYVSDFDLGLGRLCDRLLSSPDTNTVAAMDMLLMARFGVAIIVAVIAIIAGYFTHYLTTVSAFAGISVMLSNGPIVVYRARAQIAAFTLSSIATQFGMSLPRLIGLLVDGVRGCMISFGIWYGLSTVVLYAPFTRIFRPTAKRTIIALFADSTPLFFLSSSWLFYLLASRWFSYLISEPTEAGLFAFGANFVLIGIGMIGTVSQIYYPRHLILPNQRALGRQLGGLLCASTLGCLFTDLFCRFGLSRVFPHFVSADACTAAVLFSGIPLSLNAWIIPLVIARTRRPIRTGLVIFGTSLSILYGLMSVLNTAAGIEGQAWACVPPAMILFGINLRFIVRQTLLKRSTAFWLWFGVLAAEALCAVAWHFTFH